MRLSLEIIPSAHKTQVKFRSHFLGGKGASYGPGNTVCDLYMFHLVLG